jgi:hypothetical protein
MALPSHAWYCAWVHPHAPTFPVTEANIATFRRAIDEGPNNGNLAAIDELFTPDFVEHQERF